MSYRVETSEAAEAEAEALYLWILRRAPERAAAWYEGLLAAVASLADFPRRCPLARENHRFDREIRQLVYGRGGAACRILFTIIDPDVGEDDFVVRILHVRHAAQRDLGEEDTSEA
jgi:plasmid stabilization system protein ParE